MLDRSPVDQWPEIMLRTRFGSCFTCSDFPVVFSFLVIIVELQTEDPKPALPCSDSSWPASSMLPKLSPIASPSASGPLFSPGRDSTNFLSKAIPTLRKFSLYL